MPLIGATDDEWDEYFDYLQNAAFEGVIILSSAGYSGSLMSSSTIDRCMQECSERGMKVIAGLAMSQHGDDTVSVEESRKAYIKACTACANTLYSSFKQKYPDVFCGWYLSHELSNSIYAKDPEGCAELLNGIISAVDALDNDMPLLLSPFTASWGGNADKLKSALTKVFELTDFRPIDIYCPQDSVGAELTSLSNSASYYAAMKECCDKEGIQLWANIENFVISSSVPGYASETVAAPLSRFVSQLEAVKPYISGCATFTFEAYAPDKIGNYTVYTDVDYFYNAYLSYLNTGIAPDETSPVIEEITCTEPVDDYCTVTLKMKTPTYHIMTVSCTSQGRVRCFGRYYMTEIGAYTYLSFREYVGRAGADGIVYSFCAYDFASSASVQKMFGYNTQVKDLFIYEIDRTLTRKVISVGSEYTATTAATHSNGDSGNELTDGLYGASNNFGDAKWSGYNSEAISFTIDLAKSVEGVADVCVSMLAGGLGAIFEPKSIEVYVSDDNETFYPIGGIITDSASDGTLYSEKRSLELEYGVACRYVKIDINPTGWFFLDEIEIAVYE
ncbi:MAG TPA: DUF4434 domain-containing protein [Bacillota bacterium]|nr:DUF4434 domain-containing protein [Bacillota bacterium]